LEPLFHTESLRFGGFLQYGDLSFPAGKITFITGESGSGKSTLLKLLNGTASPSEGKAFYRGQDISSLDAVALRREVLLVSQEPFLFDGTVRENFDAFYGYRETPPLRDDQIKKLLQSFLLDFDPDAQTRTFSGGERQRLYTAIFLSFWPKVLLLDEPTSALDNVTGMAVLTALLDSCREAGTEVITVSHSRQLAGQFSQNTLHLGKEAFH